jgi:S1 RNA binding domain protein
VTSVDAPASNGVQATQAEMRPEETVQIPASPPASNGAAGPLEPGSIVEGTVSGITHFGAFVAVDGGATGLVHISEIAYEYVRDVRDHLKVNDRVKVKVLQVNPGNGKYDLSLKQTLEAPPEVSVRWRRGRREKSLAEGADPVFEEKLTKFLKSSEERLLDVKRNLEAKRGGRYR